MNAAGVLDEARANGVALSVTATGTIRWRCHGNLPDALRSMIVVHKGELLDLLTRPLWALLPSGMPVRVSSLDLVPEDATCWCREGDTAWKPIETSDQ
jgi:hypothetical protein